MIILDSEEFKKFNIEFQQNSGFLDNLSKLIAISGRIIMFISNKGFYTINTALLENSIHTLESIKMCSSLGNFADANTLIRKLRDDLLLYVFIISNTNKRRFTSNSNLTEDEKAVEAWLNNTVKELDNKTKKKLSYENYMKYLKQDPNIEKILKSYQLENYWSYLTTKLNDYVHNNGLQFTLHNVIKSNITHININLINVNIRTSFIITFFLILILMTESSLLSSGDAIDYLEEDLEIPEGCQYEIAPFIQKYIDEKVIKIHPELKQFLKDNNSHGMTIE
ncbi:MAG: hypothetical protein LCH35_01245 [Bacteroidetes bacterium]|jgi:hypothetical protein|uniref:hypothetical protein n=1 Tax=Flavobacterium sp. TaxID=239 RepID=UPI002FD8EB5C|nr:hypothetical protein [Bacteroidota bacterium]